MRPKKIGLALGGGGAKGLAHIGVIKMLERAGVEISYIAGTSMGALVGGWYAATKDIEKLEEIFRNVQEKDVFHVSKLMRKKDGELFKDKSITKPIEEFIKRKKVEDCMIPFAAIATDVKSGEEVVIKKGNLYEATKASTALPIIFPPVEIGKQVLMDGGFSNPVPADVVRAMGAEYVIAVDVSSKWVNLEEASLNPMHIYSVIPQALSVIEYQIARHVLEDADTVLRPPVLGFSWLDFQDAPEIVRCGKNETRNHMREILKGTGTPIPDKKPFGKFIDFLLYDEE